MTGHPLLRLEGLRKSFGEHEVLRGIDLQLAPHEVVALIGASGSGKSTLLRTVNLLETIDDGGIHLDGVDIADPRVDADAVRSRIGVVFQDASLFPWLTAGQNVELALELAGVPRAQRRGRAEELLELVRLPGVQDRGIAQLSGGAYAPFDASSAATLRDLLRAVAVYAAGGRDALTRLPGGAARSIAGAKRATGPSVGQPPHATPA